MLFEWDKVKAQSNARKHGVKFSEVEPVFYDPLAITIEDDAEGEARFITYGVDMLGRVLAVAYTWRGDSIRIISARKATQREKASYESGI